MRREEIGQRKERKGNEESERALVDILIVYLTGWAFRNRILGYGIDDSQRTFHLSIYLSTLFYQREMFLCLVILILIWL